MFFLTNKFNSISWMKMNKFLSLFLILFLLLSCGSGESKKNDKNPPNDITPPNTKLLVINKDNAVGVVRRSSDSATVVLKLALHLQKALEVFVNSSNEHFEFECTDSGNIVLNRESNTEILVNLHRCKNSWFDSVFDGKIRLRTEELHFNQAGEIAFKGIVEIEDSIAIGGENYSALSGSFRASMQKTWHGDMLIINHYLSDPIKLTSQNENLTIKHLSANLDYDFDDPVNSNFRVNFYGGLEIGIHSTELGGEFSCALNELRGFENYCSGSIDKFLKLDNWKFAGTTVFISMLNAASKIYEEVEGTGFHNVMDIVNFKPSNPQTQFQVPTIPSLEFNMPINDAVYSTSTKRAYFSVAAIAEDYSNHLVEFDLETGGVSRSIALKGEAGKLAISNDGSVIYLGYTGIYELERIETETLTLSTTLDIGGFAKEIAISPASNNIVAVTYHNELAGMKFFNSGEEQRVKGDWNSRTDHVKFNASGSRLYTYLDRSTNYGVGVLSIEPTGPVFMKNLDNFTYVPSDIDVFGDVLYTGFGQVIDPETAEILGTNTNVTGYIARKLAPLVTAKQDYTYIYAKYLQVYDKDRFTYLGSFDPALKGNFLRLLNIGSDKFAFVTDTGIKVFRHEDVPNDLDWQCGSLNRVDLRAKVDIETINCPFNDAVFSSVNDKIYASIPGKAGVKGNSLAVINSETFVIEQYLPVGSEPTELEISHNQKFLYISYGGANKYSVYDLKTLEKVMNVNLDFKGFEGPLFVNDLEPFPADDSSVLISLAMHGYTTNYAGMAVYTNGIKAPIELDSGLIHDIQANRIRFTDDNLVFGYNNESGDFDLSSFYADTSGVTFNDKYENLVSGYNTEITYSNGKIYSSRGQIIDTTSIKKIGQLKGLTSGIRTPHELVIDENRRLIYLYASMLLDGTDPVLKVFSLDTFEELNTVKMPSFSVFVSSPKTLLNLKNDRLLVVLENAMYLLDKDDLLN
jgi:hypothetical protein